MSKKEKDFVKEITPMEEDFSRWYTDVILKNELVDYSPVKGFMVIRKRNMWRVLLPKLHGLPMEEIRS